MSPSTSCTLFPMPRCHPLCVSPPPLPGSLLYILQPWAKVLLLQEASPDLPEEATASRLPQPSCYPSSAGSMGTAMCHFWLTTGSGPSVNSMSLTWKEPYVFVELNDSEEPGPG